MVIDPALLLGAVARLVNEAGMPAHAENVSVELGQIAVAGGYFDARIVADDLEELESSEDSNAWASSTGAAVTRRERRASRTGRWTPNRPSGSAYPGGFRAGGTLVP